MSATVREDLFSEYFNNCPVIKVPGRTSPSPTTTWRTSWTWSATATPPPARRHRRAATADPDSPEGSAVQAATMRAFLEGTDESFEDLLSAITRGARGFADEQALRGWRTPAPGRRRSWPPPGRGPARGGVSFARVRRGPEREVA